eukprot:1434558-Prymnesium_polylepis.1
MPTTNCRFGGAHLFVVVIVVHCLAGHETLLRAAAFERARVLRWPVRAVVEPEHRVPKGIRTRRPPVRRRATGCARARDNLRARIRRRLVVAAAAFRSLLVVVERVFKVLGTHAVRAVVSVHPVRLLVVDQNVALLVAHLIKPGGTGRASGLGKW